MSGYLSSRKLGNVKGRIRYMTDEKKQENILDYYNTTDNKFWDMLAKESRERHQETKAGGKCCEARELIIGIPLNSNISAKDICDTFKKRYGVECTCAIHYNEKETDKVKVKYKHCHLVFSERERLSVPKITEEKRALRTYYYDSTGHKCKKSEAVKVVKKGTILQKSNMRYFSDKNEHFKSQKFVYECKDMILKELLNIDWSLRAEKQDKELSEKHIGKNNPKAEYIKRNNALKRRLKNICIAGDIIKNTEKGTTLKEFKRKYGIDSFVTPTYEDNINKVFEFQDEMERIYRNEVENEVKTHNKIVDDIAMLKVPSTSSVFRRPQEEIVEQYKNESKINDIDNKFYLIDFLRNKMTNIFKRLKKLVNIQNLIDIEDKDKIDIERDKRNDKLYIIDDDYIKQQKQQELEYEDDYEL